MCEDHFDEQLNSIIKKVSPQKKKLTDVLFSTTDAITKIQGLRNMMLEAISDPIYLAQLSPEQWAIISEALTNAEKASMDFINTQARIAEKVPTIQNTYAILAGQINNQSITQQAENNAQKSFEIPKEILPIKQAIDTVMDSKFGIDKNEILEDYESSGIIDVSVENEDNSNDN